jgi:hypothetical protein
MLVERDRRTTHRRKQNLRDCEVAARFDLTIGLRQPEHRMNVSEVVVFERSDQRSDPRRDAGCSGSCRYATMVLV